MAIRGVKRDDRTLFATLLVLVLSWGALAFGAVYPWAYRPLLVCCTALGMYGLVTHGRRLHVNRPLSFALLALGLAIALQLAPLSRSTFVRVSPAGDAFLRRFDLSYAASETSGDSSRDSTPATGASRHPLSINAAKTGLGLAFLAAFGLFLLGLTRIMPVLNLDRLVSGLALLALLMAIVGIVQKAVSGESVSGEPVAEIYGFWKPRYGGNPFGPFVNRNHYAGWMVMALPFMLGYCAAVIERATSSESGWRNRLLWIGSSGGSRVLLVLFVGLIMGVSLVICASRSGALCFVVAVVVGGWFVLRARAGAMRRLVTTAALGVLLILALQWAGTAVLAERFEKSSKEASGRLLAWQDTIRIVRDFHWTGSGFNTYGTAMLLYQQPSELSQFLEAHNDYLQIAAEGGLLVGVPALIALVVFVREVRRRFQEDDGRTAYWIRAGAVTGLIAIGGQSAVDFSLQLPGNAALFVLLAAVALHQPLVAPVRVHDSSGL